MINYKKKPITQFKKGDTIYITRRGAMYTEGHYCKFIGLEGNTTGKHKNIIVVGEVLDQNDLHMKGVRIKSPVINCFLLDSDHEEHWFDKEGNIK